MVKRKMVLLPYEQYTAMSSNNSITKHKHPHEIATPVVVNENSEARRTSMLNHPDIDEYRFGDNIFNPKKQVVTLKKYNKHEETTGFQPLSSVLKKYKNVRFGMDPKTNKLLSYLESNSSRIQRTPDGELVLDGEIVPGSYDRQIIDQMITDPTPWGESRPTGVRELIEMLRNTNGPKEFTGWLSTGDGWDTTITAAPWPYRKNKVHIQPTPAKKARTGVKREQSPSKIGKLKRLVPQHATARKPKLEAWTPSPLKKKDISKQHSQVTTSNRKPYKRKNNKWVHVKNFRKKQDKQ